MRFFIDGPPMSTKSPRSFFRILMLAAAVVCFALIGFAIFSQLHWGLDPCPLCIFQRLAFAGLGVVLLIAVAFDVWNKKRSQGA